MEVKNRKEHARRTQRVKTAASDVLFFLVCVCVCGGGGGFLDKEHWGSDFYLFLF